MAGGFGDEGPSRSTRMIVARPRARGRGLAIRMSYWRSSGQQIWDVWAKRNPAREVYIQLPGGTIAPTWSEGE